MARSLDPVPEESKKSPPAYEIFKNLPRTSPKKRGSSPEGRVSFSEYTALTRDRPSKFNQEEVNYREAEGEEHCAGCLHFYIGKVAGRNVCEILRVQPEESIKPDWVCDFYTENGTEYPLFKESKKNQEE
jgi:hypothetical protein